MVCDCWQAPEDSVSHGLCKKGWKECHPKINKMGAALVSPVDEVVSVPITIR
jgi:hypothetical protein